MRSCPGPSASSALRNWTKLPVESRIPLLKASLIPRSFSLTKLVDPVTMVFQDLQGSVGGSAIDDDIFDGRMVLVPDAPDGPLNGPC